MLTQFSHGGFFFNFCPNNGSKRLENRPKMSGSKMGSLGRDQADQEDVQTETRWLTIFTLIE